MCPRAYVCIQCTIVCVLACVRACVFESVRLDAFEINEVSKKQGDCHYILPVYGKIKFYDWCYC